MIRGFRAIHPFVLLLFYISVIIGVMYYQEITFQVITLIIIVMNHFLLDRGVQLGKWLRPLFIMGILLVILTPIFHQTGTTVLFDFGLRITLESFLYGLVLALTLINMISLFVMLNITLTPEKLLFLFGRRFSRWALMIILAMRFVPLLRERLREIDEVQRFKAGIETRRNFKEKIKNGMAQIKIVLTWSLEESVQTADSMDARGYGLGERSKYHRYFMGVGDLGLLIFNICLLTLFIFTVSSGAGFHLYLQLCLLLYLLVPVFMEGRELIKWRLYQRKI